MSDLFHEKVPFEFVDHVYATMCEADQHVYQVLTKRPERMLRWVMSRGIEIPRHIWVGVSVENQFWTKRIPTLMAVPAHVRFLSCEPLLKSLTLAPMLETGGIHWVIVGGESGPRARPMHEEWARSLRDECNALAIPFFFKQWGGKTSKSGGRLLDGTTWDEMPPIYPLESYIPRENGGYQVSDASGDPVLATRP